MSSCSFKNATMDPEKLIAPMIAESTRETETTSGSVADAGRRDVELNGRNQCRRAAACAVVERDHLRHRRHLHFDGGVDADGAAEQDAGRD